MCFTKIVCTNLVLTMTVLITDPDSPSIDIVEAGLNFAGVEEESCRLRTVCEVEQAAVNNPFARFAINTINSNLSGLSKYQAAVDAGLSGQDCSLLYSQCPLSYARAFTSLL